MPNAVILSPEISVNEAIRLVPASVEVFNRYGIDACCGGAASIREAALRDGAPLDALMGELMQLAGAQS
jgi:regulator of cell morphogenesis and NO signaling